MGWSMDRKGTKGYWSEKMDSDIPLLPEEELEEKLETLTLSEIELLDYWTGLSSINPKSLKSVVVNFTTL